jgi:hypothetical protein
MYGRVGTPDLGDWLDDPRSYKREFYEEVLYKKIVWLSSQQHSQFSYHASGRYLTEEEERDILSLLKDDITVAAEEIADLLSKRGMLSGDNPDAAKKKAANLLANWRPFRRMVTR